LSGKAAKRARRDAEKNGELRQNAVKASDNSNFMKSLLRVKAKTVSIALAGSVAAAGAFWSAEQIPFWTGTERPNAVEIIYVRHSSEDKAQLVLNEIDRLNENGKQVKLIFEERARTTFDEYDHYVSAQNAMAEQIREHYNGLIKQGYSKSYAERECVTALEKQEDSFSATIDAGTAIRGIIDLPIEAYSDAEHRDLSTFNDLMNRYMDQKLTLESADAPLKQLMENDVKESMDTYKTQGFREQRIAEMLEGRFEYAKKMFPKLRSERLMGHQLFAVAYIGEAHQTLEKKIDRSDTRLEVSDKVLEPNSILGRISAMRASEQPLTKKEAYLLVVQERYFDDLSTLEKMNPNLYKTGIGNAFKLTEDQLETIADESEKISDHKARGAYILNSVLDINFFKAE
jgi:hypothetical protein